MTFTFKLEWRDGTPADPPNAENGRPDLIAEPDRGTKLILHQRT